jgi:cytochrome c553
MRNKTFQLAGILALMLAATTPALATDQSVAAAEYAEVLKLTPNLGNGRRVYMTCAVCHTPEGWGTEDGYYPQIAGQLETVLIKQLADIRARNRDNPTMYPFTMPNMLGGPQEIADVAAYISRLPMTPFNGKGPGHDLAHGERLYKKYCVDCHGENGGGNSEDHIPKLQGQHYNYLIRQFEWIRTGKRRNADPEMVKQIKSFSPRDVMAVMDYISRLRPPESSLGRPGWVNPDFPDFVRQRSMMHAVPDI